MDVFSFNREVLFSLEFKVEKILNTVSKKKATTVSIPVVEVQQLTTAIQPIVRQFLLNEKKRSRTSFLVLRWYLLRNDD